MPNMTRDFSRRFARHIRGVMAEHDVQQKALAARTGRSKGYVSEHISGKRPIETDLIAAVADEIGEPTEKLLETIARRMQADSA